MLIAKAFLCAGGDGNDDDSDDDDTKLSFIDRLILPGIILAIFINLQEFYLQTCLEVEENVTYIPLTNKFILCVTVKSLSQTPSLPPRPQPVMRASRRLKRFPEGR